MYSTIFFLLCRTNLQETLRYVMSNFFEYGNIEWRSNSRARCGSPFPLLRQNVMARIEARRFRGDDKLVASRSTARFGVFSSFFIVQKSRGTRRYGGNRQCRAVVDVPTSMLVVTRWKCTVNVYMLYQIQQPAVLIPIADRLWIGFISRRRRSRLSQFGHFYTSIAETSSVYLANGIFLYLLLSLKRSLREILHFHYVNS